MRNKVLTYLIGLLAILHCVQGNAQIDHIGLINSGYSASSSGNVEHIGILGGSFSGISVNGSFTNFSGAASLLSGETSNNDASSPTNLSATINATQDGIDLSWTDNSVDEIAFVIERSESETGPFTDIGSVAPDETAFTDRTNLQNGTTYYYRVSAIDPTGGRVTSETVNVLFFVLNAPTNLIASLNGSNDIELNWTLNTTGEDELILQKTTDGFTTIELVSLAAGTTNYTDVNTSAGNTYQYRVAVSKNGILSDYSNMVTINRQNVLTPINDLTAVARSSEQIDLSWTNLGDADQYRVERSSDDINYSTLTLLSGAANRYQDETVTAGETVFYRIVSISDTEVVSNVSSATTLLTCSYAVGSGTVDCQTTDFCVPVSSAHQLTDATGLEFTLSLESNLSFLGVSVNAAVIDPSLVDISTVTNADGSIKVALFLKANSANTDGFNGQGEILCVNVRNTLDENRTAPVSVLSVKESYAIGSISYCADTGSITIENDVTSEGRLLHYGTNAPFGYDLNAGLGKSIEISNSNDCVNFTAPVNQDENGQFEVDVRNGGFIRIVRDIEDATLVTSAINGNDAYFALRILLDDETFVPTIYQIIAADANLDGQVTAGDITLINQRSILSIGAYPHNRDWLFVDDQTLASAPFTISANYPAGDGVGYFRGNVPAITECLKLNSTLNGSCPEYPATDYFGILVGDVDANYNGLIHNFRMENETEPMITFNLDNTIWINESEAWLPIATQQNVHALDLLTEWPGEVTSNTASITTMSQNTDEGFNFTSYSQDIGKTYEDGNLFIKITGLDRTLTADQIQNSVVFINGRPGQVMIDGTESRFQEASTIENASIYPNPVTEWLTITLPKLPADRQVRVTDLTGKVLIKHSMEQTSDRIDLKNLSPGIYLLLIDEEQFKFVKL